MSGVETPRPADNEPELSNTQPPQEEKFQQELSRFLVNLEKFITDWQSFIESEMQRPTVERSPQLSQFYSEFSRLLAMIPEANQGDSQDTEADGVKLIQVSLTPVYISYIGLNRYDGEYTIAPIYTLPDGTKIEFRPNGSGFLEPIIVPSGQYIFYTDHQKNIGRIGEIINQIRQDLD